VAHLYPCESVSLRGFTFSDLPKATLQGKVYAMESNWAADHLQVIRTLMERSAVYRRALAPVMTYNGTLGVAAAALGCVLKISAPVSFVLFWAGIGVVALGGSYCLVRRQALKNSEPFWSPPTRRVTEAFLPPLVAGFIVAIAVFFHTRSAPQPPGGVMDLLWLPLAWVVLYGCALHAAGFFMPRGMKFFGWAFVLGGCALFGLGIPDWAPRPVCAHGIMGFFFGVLHLAYGLYLYFTEEGKNAA